LVWEGLVDPKLKRQWMQMRDVSADNPQGRVGMGTGYHCVHHEMEFKYWVTDWNPFSYFSTIITAPMNEAFKNKETYELIPTESGTEVRYTMAQLEDEAGVRHPEEEAQIVAFLQDFWPKGFDVLEVMLKEAS
jgi:uncharacterized protein YndB with AHSA1/START domain